MSVTHRSTDAVPAHALRRGTRGFAAVVLFLTGMIVFAVTAFVLPSIALSGTLTGMFVGRFMGLWRQYQAAPHEDLSAVA